MNNTTLVLAVGFFMLTSAANATSKLDLNDQFNGFSIGIDGEADLQTGSDTQTTKDGKGTVNDETIDSDYNIIFAPVT